MCSARMRLPVHRAARQCRAHRTAGGRDRARADTLPFRVMDPLPHTLIGLVVVSLASLALIAVTHRLPVRKETDPRWPHPASISTQVNPATHRPGHGWSSPSVSSHLRWSSAVSNRHRSMPHRNSQRPTCHGWRPDYIGRPPAVDRTGTALFHPLWRRRPARQLRALRSAAGIHGLAVAASARPGHLPVRPWATTSALLGTDHGSRSTLYLAEKPQQATPRRAVTPCGSATSAAMADSPPASAKWCGSGFRIRRPLDDGAARDSPNPPPRTGSSGRHAIRRAFNLS